MTGILKFNLPEEQSEFILASQAGVFHRELYNVYSVLNNMVKNERIDIKEIEELLTEIYDVVFMEGID